MWASKCGTPFTRCICLHNISQKSNDFYLGDVHTSSDCIMTTVRSDFVQYVAICWKTNFLFNKTSTQHVCSCYVTWKHGYHVGCPITSSYVYYVCTYNPSRSFVGLCLFICYLRDGLFSPNEQVPFMITHCLLYILWLSNCSIPNCDHVLFSHWRRLFKATIILVPVMGFTWIIGLFAVGEEGKVFAYLFVIANAFQVS